MIPSRSPEEPRPRGRWKHGPIPVIGLIGGIGGGKSAVARLLADRGSAVIDADAVGHALLEDPAIRARIEERFGAGVLEASPAADGAVPRVSRRALAGIVFADASALRDLEAILHPAMRDHFLRSITRLVRDGGRPCVVLDAAVLLEVGWDDLCDRIIFVDAPAPNACGACGRRAAGPKRPSRPASDRNGPPSRNAGAPTRSSPTTVARIAWNMRSISCWTA